MILTKKSLVIFLTILFITSIVVNIYSFSSHSSKAVERQETIHQLQEEVFKREKEVSSLKEKLDELEEKRKEINSNEVQDEKAIENDNESLVSDDEIEYINAARKFIEYTFNRDRETYTTMKKLAKNYMTDDLFNTLFSSDGLVEDEQKITTKVEGIKVYKQYDSEDELIVNYQIKEQITSTGYEETINKYVKLYFVNEDNKVKVSKIESLNYDDGGI